MMYENILNEIQNIIFPVYCGMCKSFMYDRTPICGTCRSHIRCIAPIDMSVTQRWGVSVHAAAYYDEGIVPYATAKHRCDVAAVYDFGWLMAQRCSTVISQADVIVPVPLYWWRYAHRGFDQAVIMAQAIHHYVGVPWERALYRVVWHGSQAGRSARERHENVASAFRLRRNAWSLRNKRILILDDIMASGATLCAAARTLKTVQPQSIAGLVGARSI